MEFDLSLSPTWNARMQIEAVAAVDKARELNALAAAIYQTEHRSQPGSEAPFAYNSGSDQRGLMLLQISPLDRVCPTWIYSPAPEPPPPGGAGRG